MLAFPATESRRNCMSERALEFVETWVAEKIEQEGYPEENEEAVAKAWAAECLEAASAEGIPSSEIEEAFDDLAEFIEGEIEEARERDEDEDDDEEVDEDEGDE
jgi:hypothetical protein